MGQKSKFPTQCLLCLSFSCNLIRFELGKEIEKYVFRDKEKILTHHEESNLRPSDSALRCSAARGLRIFSFVPRLWQDEKHLSLFLYRAKNLPSLLFYLQTWRYWHCWSWQHGGRVSLDLAHHSLCGSVVEHRSAKSEGLSSIPHWDSEFFLCSTLETTNIFLWLIVVLLQCRFLIGRQKQCDSLRNRTAESQSDCKDHQWFQNGWKKSQNLQVNKGFKIMKPSSSVYLGGFQRERNQGNVRLLHKNHGSANFRAVK